LVLQFTQSPEGVINVLPIRAVVGQLACSVIGEGLVVRAVVVEVSGLELVDGVVGAGLVQFTRARVDVIGVEVERVRVPVAEMIQGPVLVGRLARDRAAAPRAFLGPGQAVEVVHRVVHVATRNDRVLGQDDVAGAVVGEARVV